MAEEEGPDLPGGQAQRGAIILFRELCQREASHSRSLTAHVMPLSCTRASLFTWNALGTRGGLLGHPYTPVSVQVLCCFSQQK